MDQPIPQSFTPYYKQHIQPRIQEFEARRLAAQAKARKRRIFMFGVGITVTILSIWMHSSLQVGGPPLIFINFLLWAGAYFFVVHPLQSYKGNIKKEIFPLIFRYFGDDFRHDSYRSHSLLGGVANLAGFRGIGNLLKSDFAKPYQLIQGLERSRILPAYTKSDVDDVVTGSYKGVGIEIIETKLLKEYQTEKKKHTKLVFEGLFIHLSMNKKFSGHTVVLSDAGKIGNFLSRATTRSMENVQLEDPVFEKIFEVYSTDQIEARYLLTTSFMERLVQLRDLFKGGKGRMQACFYNDDLLLMIPTDDTFQVGSINKPVNFNSEIKTVLREMNLIFQMIDILKLDQKTGV